MLRRHIPNFLTLCNLLAGFLSILFALEKNLPAAASLILVAALFDFSDGLAARLLTAMSETGKQLDSLADVVSFGLAPAAIMYVIMDLKLREYGMEAGLTESGFLWRVLLYSPSLLLAFSAIRLARFNISGGGEVFSGLPTPASAIFFTGIAFFVSKPAPDWLPGGLTEIIILFGCVLGISILMVSNIPMLALKFKRFGFRGNEIRYIFLAVSGILLIILHEIALTAIILFYIILSLLSK